MSKILATASAALCLTASLALAQMAEGPWTMEEFIAAHPEVTPEIYALIDADGDGMVDQDELDAAVAAGLVTLVEG